MSKHPVFCSLLQLLHDDHSFSPDPFGAPAGFKVLLQRAKKQTIRELSRKTPDSNGAKLLMASAALRAYRNKHLGTLMRCCEAWKPIEDCFDPISFESVDFQRLSQIIANLTRETLAEREAEITNLPWTQTEEDTEPDAERVEGPRHHEHEDILRYVQQAPDDIRWTIDKTEFDDLIALKKDSAPGPDGILWCLQVCRESWFAIPL